MRTSQRVGNVNSREPVLNPGPLSRRSHKSITTPRSVTIWIFENISIVKTKTKISGSSPLWRDLIFAIAIAWNLWKPTPSGQHRNFFGQNSIIHLKTFFGIGLIMWSMADQINLAVAFSPKSPLVGTRKLWATRDFITIFS
jgi:hypothetical protein